MDLDRDGDLDLVEGNDEQPNLIHLNQGEGHFSAMALGEEALDSYCVAIGDMDGDGYDDIVIANSGAANQVFLVRPKVE